ncbi:hypothetical protein Pyn_29482 [Prunus yedoensis var. nudiflora]|uniref:Uncharacterized protein n=1 Tax=Prunus yedoensis var. nudiflora TaxID=2094558 RepID=A0A314UFK5_PRUYE|nr:hypothetical protein Pyn_29482 [Prunus yedoensis var. nudiflora]
MSVFGGFLGAYVLIIWMMNLVCLCPTTRQLAPNQRMPRIPKPRGELMRPRNNVGSSSSSSKPKALAEEPQSDALSFAPSFDGLFCFETLASKFIKPT